MTPVEITVVPGRCGCGVPSCADTLIDEIDDGAFVAIEEPTNWPKFGSYVVEDSIEACRDGHVERINPDGGRGALCLLCFRGMAHEICDRVSMSSEKYSGNACVGRAQYCC